MEKSESLTNGGLPQSRGKTHQTTEPREAFPKQSVKSSNQVQWDVKRDRERVSENDKRQTPKPTPSKDLATLERLLISCLILLQEAVFLFLGLCIAFNETKVHNTDLPMHS